MRRILTFLILLIMFFTGCKNSYFNNNGVNKEMKLYIDIRFNLLILIKTPF